MAKVLALKVEGVGNADGLYRFFHGSAAPGSAQDPYSLYQRALLQRPQSTGWQIDIAQWLITQDGISFQLRATDLVKTMFWQPNPLGATRSLKVDSTYIYTEDDMSGEVLWWSTRECTVMGTMAVNGGPEGGFYDGTALRGHLSTVQKSLDSWENGDYIAWTTPPAGLLKDRRVWLVSLELDGVASEVVEWTGVVTDITSDKPGLISVSCDSTLTWLESLTIGSNRQRRRKAGPAKTVVSSDGKRTEEGAWYKLTSGEQYGVGIDSDGKWVASLGGKGLAKMGFSAVLHPDSLANGETAVWPVGPLPDYAKPPLDIWQCFPTAPINQNQNSGVPTDNKSLPFSNNRFDLALQLLQTGPDPTGPNGTHDMGLKGMGCNIHEDNINVAAFTALAEFYGPVAPVSALVLLEKTADTPVFEFIQKELLEAVDCMMVPDPLTGFIDVVSLHPLPELGDVLTEILQFDLVRAVYPPQKIMNITIDSVKMSHSNVPGWGPIETTLNDVTTRHRNVRRTEGIPLRWDGIEQGDVVLANGAGSASSLGIEYLFRRHFPYPLVVVTIKDQAKVKLLKPGQRVKVTHPKIYSARDGQGVTGDIFTVLGGRRNANTWEYDLVNLHARVIGGQYISAALKAAATGGGATITITQSEFTGEDGGPYNLDHLAIEAGDVLCWLRYEDLAVQETGLVVASTTTTSVTFTGAPTYTHRVGDILAIAPYDEATQNTDRDTWMADSNNRLDGDDPNRWS